jgi:two-component system chemotaxis response regulator CheB
VRLRSSPERLANETSRFVRFLAGAVSRPASIADSAASEVRDGCLAAATPGELAAVFALWRRVLRSYLASVGSSGAEPMVHSALEAMESASLAEAQEWAKIRFDLVVVGASAGGVEALTKLLESLVASTPATVAIVQHIGPADRGLLPMVLARHSRLAIAAAVDGAKLYLGHAYIAPPGRHLVVTAEALRLVDGPPVHFVKPAADVLFESAAVAFRQRVISVVLSGTGRDGAAGTFAIRDHGGTTFCQDPDDAEFRGMPEAALATGSVDKKLPLGALVKALADTIRDGRAARATDHMENA